MNIKAIPTRYKGYHFRSRLEARWAVAFDSMRLPWEYEREGYELQDGTRYLPDFWLPTEDCFVEVKGNSRDWSACRDAEEKLILLSRATGKHCLYVFQPDGHSIDIWADDLAPAGYWMGSRALLTPNAIASARSARFEHGQSGATA